MTWSGPTVRLGVGQLDPEDLVELIAAYHDAAAKVIERFHGHVAQYQGDGAVSGSTARLLARDETLEHPARF